MPDKVTIMTPLHPLFRWTKLQLEGIVAELVSSFLLPEVQKITVRENGKDNAQFSSSACLEEQLLIDMEGLILISWHVIVIVGFNLKLDNYAE